MARTPRWEIGLFKDGVETITLSSFKYFHDLLKFLDLLEKRVYIFRGQKNSDWLVEPSIHRHLKKKMAKGKYQSLLEKHLENFKFSIRGRIPRLNEIINNENELWALGQHHGLQTPFLDFASSPYVAAYFAFIEKENSTSHRTIWVVSGLAVDLLIEEELELYHPLSDVTPRLISQDGIFVKFNVRKDLKTLIGTVAERNKVYLYEVKIPNSDREFCLKSLNRMNINHKSLFPDLLGASIYSNLHLEINKY